jgi:AbiU2
MNLPSNLQPMFDRLHDDLVGLYVRWQMYRQLFGTNEQRIALLNTIAPSFFGTVHLVLLDDVMSGIARMTDNLETCGKNNLVLRRLIAQLDSATHVSLIGELSAKLAVVESTCAPIREIRHKRLAHRDYQTAIAPTTNPLPAITREVVEKALAAIADLMNAFQFPFTNDTIRYSETITALGDGNSLVRSLRRSVEHRKLEREGRVPPIGTLSAEYHDA